jgi:hypothetical protein
MSTTRYRERYHSIERAASLASRVGNSRSRKTVNKEGALLSEPVLIMSRKSVIEGAN